MTKRCDKCGKFAHYLGWYQKKLVCEKCIDKIVENDFKDCNNCPATNAVECLAIYDQLSCHKYF